MEKSEVFSHNKVLTAACASSSEALRYLLQCCLLVWSQMFRLPSTVFWRRVMFVALGISSCGLSNGVAGGLLPVVCPWSVSSAWLKEKNHKVPDRGCTSVKCHYPWDTPMLRFISDVSVRGTHLAHTFLYPHISWIMWWTRSIEIKSIKAISFCLTRRWHKSVHPRELDAV